ncbi:hypothetical protein BVX97_05515 [bacterium E08(2017)]|nr:hypothetical protein BVX97_05515 [bacterium E08(2017)]
MLYRFFLRRKSLLPVKTAFFLLFSSCLLSSVQTASALESFRFLNQQRINAQSPSAMAPLGDDNFAIHDNETDELLFLSSDYELLKRLPLTTALGPKYKGIDVLEFNFELRELYALDSRSRIVFVFSTNGELIRKIDLNIKKPVSISKATSMAIDASDRLYIGDSGRGDIKVFNLQGVFLYTIHKPSLSLDSAPPKMEISGMAIHSDGKISILDTKDDTIVTFSRPGTLIQTRNLDGKIKKLKRLILTDSNEYISFDSKLQKIFKWDMQGRLAALLGTKGKGRGKFSKLEDIILTTNGSLVALDSKLQEIQIFEYLENPARYLSGKTPRPAFNLTYEREAKFDKQLVSMLSNGMVLFNQMKQFVIVRRDGIDTLVQHPEFKDVSASSLMDDRWFFFDRSRRKVYAFDARTQQFLFEFGGRGRSDGSLDDVSRILPTDNKTLFLADVDDTKIQIFSTDGIFSTRFGNRGSQAPEDISKIDDAAFYHGKLAVLDNGRDVVHTFDSDGKFVRNIHYMIPEEKARLTALDIDPNDFMLVLDKNLSRIFVLNENGETPFRFGSAGTRSMDWAGAERIYIDENGSLQIFIPGTPNRIAYYTLITPGPIARVETALDTSDWQVAKDQLLPYINARDEESAPTGYRRAMILAMKGDSMSDVAFLSKSQRQKIRSYLHKELKKTPDDTVIRIALVRNLHKNGDIKDALVLLHNGIEKHPDPRLNTLASTYEGSMAQLGLDKSVIGFEDIKIPKIYAALYQNYYDHPVIEVTIRNNGGETAARGLVKF